MRIQISCFADEAGAGTEGSTWRLQEDAVEGILGGLGLGKMRRVVIDICAKTEPRLVLYWRNELQL